MRASRRGTLLLGVGSAVLVMGILVVAALDLAAVREPRSLLRDTISHLGLTDVGPLFEAAVLAIAIGAAGVFTSSAIARSSGRPSVRDVAGWVFAAIAVIGLVLVAAFTKQDWSQPPSAGGTIHRIGSLAAFLAAPVAVLLLARRSPWEEMTRRAGAAARLARGAVICAWLGLMSFLPLIVAVAITGPAGRWWSLVPLGLVERAIAIGDMAALVLFAALCLRETRYPAVIDDDKPALSDHPRTLGYTTTERI